jgi:3-hydroxy-9,10-secoandrosta-1,3,5(10)-triene-9,17-dione monooxygenase
VAGGFVVSGKWPFSSGVDNSDWNMLAVTIYGDDGKTAIDWRLCLVPKADYQIHDTWYAMGMVGTGSKDIEAKEIFVPERRALEMARCKGGSDHPGGKVNPGQLFQAPLVAAAGHPLSATALGTAEGAYEHVKEKFATRIGTYTGAKVADFQAVQVKMAKARCLVDSARCLMRESAILFGSGARLDMETKLRLRAQNTFAVMQCREAVETLWSFYGANAIYLRDPLQRYLRDAQTINQHFSFNFDIAGSAFGTAALGGKYAHPTM